MYFGYVRIGLWHINSNLYRIPHCMLQPARATRKLWSSLSNMEQMCNANLGLKRLVVWQAKSDLSFHASYQRSLLYTSLSWTFVHTCSFFFIMNFRELHCILHPTMEKLRQSTFCLKEKQTRQLWISMAETVFTWQSGPTTSNTSSMCNASSSWCNFYRNVFRESCTVLYTLPVWDATSMLSLCTIRFLLAYFMWNFQCVVNSWSSEIITCNLFLPSQRNCPSFTGRWEMEGDVEEVWRLSGDTSKESHRPNARYEWYSVAQSALYLTPLVFS